MSEVQSDLSCIDDTVVLGIQGGHTGPHFTELTVVGETKKKAVSHARDRRSVRVSSSQGLLAWLKVAQRGSPMV